MGGGRDKMKISVVGTGYVGLVTGVCLSHIGHDVTCIDIDESKITRLNKAISPIYEPGLSELMEENISKDRLHFTSDFFEGLHQSDAVYLAVGTPQSIDGSADLSFIRSAATMVAENLSNDIVVVVKSTVPVGTNDQLKELIQSNTRYNISVVSNPEFLREGTAIYDSFNGDRIVIGSDSPEAADLVADINEPMNVPILKTDTRSAEMIKYASNAFLATKISFINAISNLCEKVNANIDLVAEGIGKDSRIGNKFLKAGIGYGGSCFPKDTHALLQIAQRNGLPFDLLDSVIDINEKQKSTLIEKARKRFGTLLGKRIALLGLAFKPGTDDMRESPAITIAEELVKEGATVIGYDPVATENAQRILPNEVLFAESLEEALLSADAVFIVTDWDEIKSFEVLEKSKVVFDGRNCFDLKEVELYEIEYYSVGRPDVVKVKELIGVV
jgi:UDPglucose 6-dehydrogenase